MQFQGVDLVFTLLVDPLGLGPLVVQICNLGFKICDDGAFIVDVLFGNPGVGSQLSNFVVRQFFGVLVSVLLVLQFAL